MTKDFFDKLEVGQMLELKHPLLPTLPGQNVFMKVIGETKGRTSREELDFEVYWYDQYICSVSAALDTENNIMWVM